MVNPARALAGQFVRRSQATLLDFSIALSFVDFVALYTAAAREGVLRVNQGVGLLNNYGLFSTILGNAVLLYLAKKFYDVVRSMGVSGAVVNTAPIKEPLSTLTAMIEMEGKYQFPVYLLIIIGASAWLSNVGSHVLGNPEVRWGQKVFDSVDHPLTFVASRLHNLYTWVILMPLVAHVVISSSFQLRRAITMASREGALKYDLLHPDQRGGFVFVDKAHFVFNVIVALIFIQITLHVGTFEKINSDHVLAYIALIMMLVVLYRAFLGDIYTTIKRLRLESLNELKESVRKDDKLSFEILKYCYERRTLVSSAVDFVIKASPIVISGIVQLWPVITGS